MENKKELTDDEVRKKIGGAIIKAHTNKSSDFFVRIQKTIAEHRREFYCWPSSTVLNCLKNKKGPLKPLHDAGITRGPYPLKSQEVRKILKKLSKNKEKGERDERR